MWIKIVLYSVVVIFLLLVVLYIIGSFVPSRRIFETDIVYSAPIQDVWDRITDVEGQVHWRKDIKKVVRIDSGKVIQRKEYPLQGKPISFAVTEKKEPSYFSIVMIDSPVQGSWEGKLYDQGDGTTQGIFREIVDIHNPMLRLIFPLFVDMQEIMDTYAHDLQKSFE